jgi:hypothetical protein
MLSSVGGGGGGLPQAWGRSHLVAAWVFGCHAAAARRTLSGAGAIGGGVFGGGGGVTQVDTWSGNFYLFSRKCVMGGHG